MQNPIIHNIRRSGKNIWRSTIIFMGVLVVLGLTAVPRASTAPILGATKTDALIVDIDQDGVADPGDTIRYTTTINNTGTSDATNVNFLDTIDANTTLVAGSVRTTPIARNDSYTSIGNVGITVPAGSGVLANDNDPDGTTPTLTVIAAAGSSTNGGAYSLAANGSFSYLPPTGFTGTDTFSYTVQDTDGNQDSATVSITVSDMIWFIDNNQTSPGNGTLNTPFNSLSGFNGSSLDSTGDTIFLYRQAAANYTGGIALLNNQILIGQGATDTIANIAGITVPPHSNTLPSTNGTRPVISNGSGNGINLANGNTIRGLNVGNSSGTGVIGTSVGTLTISEVNVEVGGNVAVNIDGGALAVTFDKVSASASTTAEVGISLKNTTGTFTVAGGSTAGSGGTIAGKIGGNTSTTSGIGIYLNNVQGISLNRMQLNDFDNFAIRGVNVTNFTMTNTVINGTNGNSAGDDEGSVSFDNLLGTATFTNNTISGGLEDNIVVINDTGTLDRMTVSGGTIGHNNNTLGNDGILVESQSSATLKLTVTGTNFTGARGDMIQCNAIGTSTMDCIIRDNTFNNGQSNSLGGGITISGGSATSNINLTYEVSGSTAGAQTFQGAVASAITVNIVNGSGTVQGIVRNNTIGASGAANSGSTTGAGVAIGANVNIDHRVLIDNNTIYQTNTFGVIDLLSNNAATLNATVTNNNIAEFGALTISGVYSIVGGATVSDTSHICLDMRNNTLDTTSSFGFAYYIDQVSSSASYNFPGYVGPTTGGATLNAFINGQNTTIGTAGDSSLAQNVTGTGTTCLQPVVSAPINSGAVVNAGESGDYLAEKIQKAEMAMFSRQLTTASSPTSQELAALEESGSAFNKSSLNKLASLPPLSGETINLALGLINAGQIVVITFDVTVDNAFSATQVCNQGLITSDNFSNVLTDDPDVGGSADPTCTAVPQANLSISKSDSADPVTPSSNFDYALAVTNNGPSAAQSVSVSDTLPAGVTYVTDDCSLTGTPGPTVTWIIGSLANTATATCNITVTAPAAQGSISNSATVSSTTHDPDTADNSTSESTLVGEAADLIVSKTESIDPVVAGSGTGNLTYVVTVKNDGPYATSGVTLSEVMTLPAGVTVSSITPSQGTFGGTTWTVGSLAVNQSETLTVVLTVAANAAVGTDVISNTATVTASDKTLINTGDDSVTISTSVTREVDLKVTKTESIDPVAAGSGTGNLTYVVTVENKGPSDASGITLNESLTLPSGVSVDSITPSTGTTFSDPTWTVPTLAKDQTATLTAVLTVGASAAAGTDVIADTATVTGANETLINTNDDSATEATSIVVKGSVTLIKSVTNNNGGKAGVNDFGLSIGGTPVNSGDTLDFSPGTIVAIDETSLTGYAFVQITGTGCPAVLGGTITVQGGVDLVCTIKNDDIAPQLTVIKNVVNDHGGTAAASNFNMFVVGTNVSTPNFPGDATGTTVTLNAGAYTVGESSLPAYTPSYSADCVGSIAIGEQKTCIVTNDDVAPQLTVIKNVVNDHGGTAAASDFNMFVSGTEVSNSSFPGDEAGTTVTLKAGTYEVSEDGRFGYAEHLSADCLGSIAIGESKTCTITNNDIAPQLTVIKEVINFGGPHSASDFTMSVNGKDVSPNDFPGSTQGTVVTLDAGSYNVSEDGPNGYTAVYSDDCDSSIGIGQEKVCMVTNTAKPAKLKVNKDADPSEVWEPGGNVEFIIDIRNSGPVRPIIVTDIDDSYFGSLDNECDLPVEVPAGQTYTCRFTEYISGNGGDIHYNQVTVTAEDRDGNVLTDTSDEDVHILDIPSSLSVTKDAAKSEVLEPGENLLFTVTAKNTSQVDAVTIESITDTVFGDLTAECLPSGPEPLQVDETFTCDFTRFVGGAVGDIHSNTITVSGTDDDGFAVSDSNSEQVLIDNVASSIKVDYKADPEQVYEPGADVNFTVDIGNTSAADNVTIDYVEDTVFGDVTAECLASGPVTLIPGETYSCTFTRYISGQMGDVHTSTVTVTGIDDDGNAVSDSANESVIVLDSPSSLLVTKTAHPHEVVAPGGDVTFTVTILNDSAVDEILVEHFVDPVHPQLVDNCSATLPAPLQPGQSITCQLTTYIGGQPGDVHTSRAAASGTDDDGYPVSDMSEVSVHVVISPTGYAIFFPAIYKAD